MKLWIYLFQCKYLEQQNIKPTISNIKSSGLDNTSMELLKETDNAYIVLYSEGKLSSTFINIVYTDGRELQTIEL